ncbi:MAG: VWA domain-containing protein [Clostridia bacterium]|nr:VWA domain-containing protein [Clostridia bacterium]
MTNFRIEFSHPWLLLLIIPAIILTLLPYLKLAKRYRRTRNRVVSVVLHAIVMVLAITILSGITFKYEIPNNENELLLLVDSSYSSHESEAKKEDFVGSVIKKCGSAYKVGVVKFGYDQVYAAKLSTDSESVYEEYMQSDDPDTTATDVESALRYASTLFTNKKTSKIVVISDGIETDGDAMDVIREIAAEGIKVDTVYYPNSKHAEVQIVDVVTPTKNIKVEEQFRMQIMLETNVTGGDQKVSIVLHDNDTVSSPVEIELEEEQQTIEVTYSFEEAGLHQLRFEIEGEEDTLSENNAYYSYIYLQVFENVLIIEKDEGEGSDLEDILTAESDKFKGYKVTRVSLEQDLEAIPTDIKGLSAYEQVVLVNVANKDMPAGFDELLHNYVYNLGGGLFTVGGNNDSMNGKVVPHMYNRDDMINSLYQEMLPVNVVNYTPPIAVMILIDASGSMGSGEGSNLRKAIDGAYYILDHLKSNAYCGIAVFQDEYDEELTVTPVSKRKEIEAAIDKISDVSGGGTVFASALEGACDALTTVDVVNRHIIMITDGVPSDEEDFLKMVEMNAGEGVTMSILCINTDESIQNKMAAAATMGGGKGYPVTNLDQLGDYMYEDLMTEAIAEIAYGEEFQLRIEDRTAAVKGIVEKDIPKLKGYYGTQLKSGAKAPLMGKYVPIYAEWDYGIGTVGSFMCDLNGTWSSDFIQKDTGKQIVQQIVGSLFPSQPLSTQEIMLSFNDDNYTTYMNVYTELTITDIVEVTVKPLSDEAIEFYAEKPIVVQATSGFTRFNFDITCPGVYQLTVVKKDGNGVVLAEKSMYRTFSYSEEYDAFPDEETTGEAYLTELAEDGRGTVISEPFEVFASFAKTLKKEYDPRLLFAIIATVLFLLDIAVRKFKFKWPHEIIRDYRAKQEYIK